MQLISTLRTTQLAALGLTALSVITGISAAPSYQATDVSRLQARGPLEDYWEAKKKVEEKGIIVSQDQTKFAKKDENIGSFTYNACMGMAILGKKGSLLGHYSCYASGNDWLPVKDIPKLWEEHKDDLDEDTKTYYYAQEKGNGGWDDEDRVNTLKKTIKDVTGKEPEKAGYLAHTGFMDDYGNIKKEFNKDKVFGIRGGIAVVHKSFAGIDRDGPADIYFFKTKDQKEHCKA